MGGGFLNKLTGVVTPNTAVCSMIVKTTQYCCSKIECYHNTGNWSARCQDSWDNYGNKCDDQTLINCGC